MGERRDFQRPYQNIGADSPPDWLEEEAPTGHLPQMDIADANLFGMERFLEGPPAGCAGLQSPPQIPPKQLSALPRGIRGHGSSCICAWYGMCA